MAIYKAIRTALGKAFLGDTFLAKALPLSSPDMFDDRLISFMQGLRILDEPRIIPGPAIEGPDIRAVFVALHPTNNFIRVAAIEAMLGEAQARNNAIAAAITSLEERLTPVSIPTTVAYALDIHSAGVIQPLSTLVAAGSFIKVRPVDTLWNEFELTLDLRFLSDELRASNTAGFKIPKVEITAPWASAFFDRVEAFALPSGDVPFNGHLTSLTTYISGGKVGAMFISLADPNYIILTTGSNWTDLLSASGTSRLLGTFRVGGI